MNIDDMKRTLIQNNLEDPNLLRRLAASLDRLNIRPKMKLELHIHKIVGPQFNLEFHFINSDGLIFMFYEEDVYDIQTLLEKSSSLAQSFRNKEVEIRWLNDVTAGTPFVTTGAPFRIRSACIDNKDYKVAVTWDTPLEFLLESEGISKEGILNIIDPNNVCIKINFNKNIIFTEEE